MIAVPDLLHIVVLRVPAAHLVTTFGDIAMCPHIARWTLITMHNVCVPELCVYDHTLCHMIR
jgi:hypothetical protein